MRRRSIARTMTRAMPFAPAGHMSSVLMLLVSVLCMGISAFKPQVFEQVRHDAQNMSAPVLSVISIPFQKISLLVSDISSIAALQATNERLEMENARLREWYQAALLLEAENKSLRNLLNLRIDPQYSTISARIIGNAGSAYVKSLMLDSGSDSGVAKGMPVLSGEGLAGRIIESFPSASRVLLVTDMNSRVPIVVSDTMQHAIMAGNNSAHPKLIHLPQDSEIADGAHIVTSGHGGIYPPGLPVGRVITDPDGVKRVELFANIGRLQYLRILSVSTPSLIPNPQ